MSQKGIQGGSLGGYELSPARKKRNAARKRAQEKRWQSKNGPVIVTRKDDDDPVA